MCLFPRPLFYLLFFAAPVQSLAGISGLVVDSETGKPLADANVVVLGTKYGAATREDGSFELDIPPGSYKLEVSMIGYDPKVVGASEETGFVRVELHPSPIPLEPIEVIGERLREVRKEEKEIVYSPEIKDLPTVKPDIFRTLQTLPGVTTTTDLAGWLFVRGGEPEENLYLLDGGEVISPYHLLGVESVFSPELIGKAEFSPGGFGAEYGNRLSAVLDITSREPDLKGSLSKFGCDATEIWGTFETSLARNCSFAVTSRRGYVDLLLERMDLGKNIILPYYWDFQGKLSFRFGENRLSLTELRSTEKLKLFAVVEGQSVGVRWVTGSNLLGVNYNHLFSPSTELRISGFLSSLSANTTTENLFDWRRDEDQSLLGMKTSFATTLTEAHSLELGAELQRQDCRLSATMPEDLFEPQVAVESQRADTTASLYALYLKDRYDLRENLQLGIGVRFDYFPITKERLSSPRARLSYRLSDLTQLELAWGHYYQLPALHHLGNSIKAQKASHFVLGAEWNLWGDISFRVNLYDKELDGLITHSEDRGFENRGFGFSRGAELILRKGFGTGTYGWFSYTYSKSRRKTMEDSTLIPFDADQPHVLNLLASTPLPWKFRLGVKLRYASGTPYTPILGKVWDSERWQPAYGERNSERLPPYQRLDVRVQRGFGLFGREASLYFQLINLLRHRNLQGYIYDPRSNLRVPYYMLPFIPVFGFEMSL